MRFACSSGHPTAINADTENSMLIFVSGTEKENIKELGPLRESRGPPGREPRESLNKKSFRTFRPVVSKRALKNPEKVPEVLHGVGADGVG